MKFESLAAFLLLCFIIYGCSKKNNPTPQIPAPTSVTISNFTIPSKYIDDVDFTILAPGSNSNADFSYISDDPAVATVKGNTIHITGVGTVNITVTQTATKNYTAASAKTTFTVLPNIYIAGSSYVTADGNLSGVYWKNGNINYLEGHGLGTDIFVQGKDVYVAGSISDIGAYYKPGYWRNGVKHLLSNGSGETSAIAVSGTDVYVVGTTFSELDPNDIHPTVWKNGNIMTLPNPLDINGKAVPKGVIVYNNKVYIFGKTIGSNGTGSSPIVWNGDGSVFMLSKEKIVYSVNSLFFQGNDLFMCGSIYTNNHYLVYWKNDVANSIINASANEDAYSSMTVVGSDVYITGTDLAKGTYTAAYWKNGLQTELAQNAMAMEIASQGKDIYIVGASYLSYNYYDYIPVYWLNGNLIKLSGPKGTNATSIAIIDHK
ncbi:hypothetical protein ACFFGT_16500 [Mucilaginibacter angelicae]|uniref:BIG2 domain-containing protein n=1 Tax=Mucilaginibacter angelicae TaxID=869718 RepID=A0ABV6L8R1_9SPHI